MDLQKLGLSEAALFSGPLYGSYPSSLFLQSLTASPLMYQMLSTIPYPCPPPPPYSYRSTCYPYPVASSSPPGAAASAVYAPHLLGAQVAHGGSLSQHLLDNKAGVLDFLRHLREASLSFIAQSPVLPNVYA